MRLASFRMMFISSPRTSVAGITGTLASIATFLAEALSPKARMVSALGPINVIPLESQASTKFGFSLNSP